MRWGALACRSMSHPQFDSDLAVAYLDGSADADALFTEACRLRDEGHGKTITFSKKVFVPLTTLCRDRCTYCTFAKPPGGGGEYLEPEEVLAIVTAGERHGCTEALVTLGDRPEDRWDQARRFLEEKGHESTLDYVQEMTELIASETAVFPHANPGLMSEGDIRNLRPSNPSMGLMLENISPRLMDPGMPHFDCPDKDPVLRMRTIEGAGRAAVPFTSGILVGIGETNREIVDSLVALNEANSRRGQIQEIIIQNFRAKDDTRMRASAEPIPAYFARVVAVARWIFGPEMNIQVPPNLTERYETYLDAGINDWGGVSPLTIDWVNPEQPWPHLEELEARTTAAGFELRPRLPVYPEFLNRDWIDETLLTSILAVADNEGYAEVRQGVGS